MCGISLIVSRNNTTISQELVKLVNEKIEHRGPNGEGYYFKDNLAFGHRRLSVIDLSHKADQPMEKEGNCIIFNGMIFNYLELKNELCLLGHSFKSKGDTEVILAAYQEWGVEAFSKFNGMWAFIIHDSLNNKLILSRDRFGIKPLYITTIGEYFLAGSEIKQFTDFPDFQPVLNQTAAYHFLTSGVTNYSDETFFEGVNELRPGHFMEYDLTTHEQKTVQWYNLKNEVKYQHICEEDAIKLVRDLFTDSVYIRSRADVKVGSCLSGGLDSSSIVTVMYNKGFARKDFATVTSCYMDKDCDEQEYSDVISSYTSFRSIKVFPDLNDLLDKGDWNKMIYQLDQPFSSASHYSEYSVFKEAKKHDLTVMLDGQGADEYICGYWEFFYLFLKELISRGQFNKVWSSLKCKASHNKSSVFSESLQFIKYTTYYPFKKRVKNFLYAPRHPWLISEAKPGEENKTNAYRKKDIGEASLHQMMYSSIGYQLHSQDRNSMMFSIESRAPFLDHRLIENIIGMPSGYKIKNGYSKHLLLKAINELPDMVKYRKTKMSFAAPDAAWMRENHIRIRKELEEAINYTGMFSKRLLLMFDKFIKNKTYYDHYLFFRVISFCKFCKIFKMKFRASSYAVGPYVFHAVGSAAQ